MIKADACSLIRASDDFGRVGEFTVGEFPDNSPDGFDAPIDFERTPTPSALVAPVQR